MKGAAWYDQRPGFLDRALALRRMPWLRVDWHVLLVVLLLLGPGLAFMSAMAEADELQDRDGVRFAGHVSKLLVALPAFLVAFLVKPRWLRRNAWVLYGLCLVLLLLMPFLGEERNNARSWIPLPGTGFDLQPSELAKLGTILALARYLYTSRLRTALEWARAAAIALAPMLLVFLQPDLGTALTIVPVALGMLYVAGGSGRRILQALGAVVVVLVLAFQLDLVQDYQQKRVGTWLSSFGAQELIESRHGPAFHTYHARVAIGNGGWLGTGLGRGVANQAAILPERDCDSVFAVVAEEAGFVGASAIVLLYSLLIVLLLQAASGIRERFSRLVVGGVGLYFGAHVFINVGVNLGLLPMTGLTLPLFSTGGSSLLVTFAALGLALGLSAQREATLDQDAFRA